MHVHLPDSLVTWPRMTQPPLTAAAVSAKCNNDACASHSTAGSSKQMQCQVSNEGFGDACQPCGTAGSPRDSPSVTPAFRLPQGFRAPELRGCLGRHQVTQEGPITTRAKW